MRESILSSKIPALHSSAKSRIFSRVPLQCQWEPKLLVAFTYRSFSTRGSCTLQSALQHICRCADSCCNCPCCQRSRNVDWNPIGEPDYFIREEPVLCRRISGIQLAPICEYVQAAYTAICDTSTSCQPRFKKQNGLTHSSRYFSPHSALILL